MSLEPYATWDRNLPLATDKPDGFPDRAMIPLVTALRAAGFTTYQSCSGHLREGDGTLWIREGPQRGHDPDPFTRIQHVYKGPEGDYWEFWWESLDARRAIAALSEAYGVEPIDPGVIDLPPTDERLRGR